jgi:hypothetical protein
LFTLEQESSNEPYKDLFYIIKDAVQRVTHAPNARAAVQCTICCPNAHDPKPLLVCVYSFHALTTTTVIVCLTMKLVRTRLRQPDLLRRT